MCRTQLQATIGYIFGLSLVAASRGYSLAAVCGLLTAVASLVAKKFKFLNQTWLVFAVEKCMIQSKCIGLP